jgi:hypothetical protein
VTKREILLLITAVAMLGLAIGFSLYRSAGGRGHHEPSTAATATEATTAIFQPTPVNVWNVNVTTDDVTGEVTKVADDSLGAKSIIVRKKGKKLEVYINTDEFLETVETIETGVSQVAYKFDDGPVTRQWWHLSEDHEGLFYPGDPTRFLEKLAKAKTFAFQYRPADKVPQSTTFDVEGLAVTDFVVASAKVPAQHLPPAAEQNKLTAAAQVPSPTGETVFNYPECEQRDPSLSAKDCSDRLLPGAPIVQQCASLATADPGNTQPEEYRVCAAKAPK